jgi:hypothetical protein
MTVGLFTQLLHLPQFLFISKDLILLNLKFLAGFFDPLQLGIKLKLKSPHQIILLGRLLLLLVELALQSLDLVRVCLLLL